MASDVKSREVNLLGSFRPRLRDNKRDYRAVQNRVFPSKISGSSFLLLYTLFLLNKRSEPLYGREMLEQIQATVNVEIWKPSNGTYYPLLENMVTAGLIVIANDTGIKKYYSITKAGKIELKNKLGEFKTMLIQSSNFFSNVMKTMYSSNMTKEDEVHE